MDVDFFLMFFFLMCVCVCVFLRQECLGMPELQRAAEFFFFSWKHFEMKKNKKVNMLNC